MNYTVIFINNKLSMEYSNYMQEGYGEKKSKWSALS